MQYRFRRWKGALLLLLLPLWIGCVPQPASHPPQADPIRDLLSDRPTGEVLQRMGYATQVGAFTNLDNAVRLEQSLAALGIDAYHFRHESGLYKVRFGNHDNYQAARAEAESLQARGLIGEFFIVLPEDYAVARQHGDDAVDLRDELVHTARSFLGVPYRWGGVSAEKGFDCSGLTQVCYRLNGLDLPRVSYLQYDAGRKVDRDKLQKGDLVFFATRGGRRVSHVGMYIGGDRFIHAPRTGQTVRIEKLSNSYFAKTFVGGRSYF